MILTCNIVTMSVMDAVSVDYTFVYEFMTIKWEVGDRAFTRNSRESGAKVTRSRSYDTILARRNAQVRVTFLQRLSARCSIISVLDPGNSVCEISHVLD